MSGRELQKQQSELGVSPADVCSEAGISISSLYKVYNGEHVRPSTVAKVRNALARIRARVLGDQSATG
jgi:predicted transcriptional regulator